MDDFLDGLSEHIDTKITHATRRVHHLSRKRKGKNHRHAGLFTYKSKWGPRSDSDKFIRYKNIWRGYNLGRTPHTPHIPGGVIVVTPEGDLELY